MLSRKSQHKDRLDRPLTNKRAAKLATLFDLALGFDQALTLSFSALAIANFTCLSAALVTISPVAGLRT